MQIVLSLLHLGKCPWVRFYSPDWLQRAWALVGEMESPPSPSSLTHRPPLFLLCESDLLATARMAVKREIEVVTVSGSAMAAWSSGEDRGRRRRRVPAR